ncbi:hypothetical protein RGI145_24205 (plasmid) [Roseomonas gilardii]|uniref:Uncharacterized protein n=1 Tax=Roseomonas gilardii TaxID=257708 RepID=A0A1L7ANW2_9PROT|nr:hypothetical protein RGI145_24205 [Roseomonas gilardii]
MAGRDRQWAPPSPVLQPLRHPQLGLDAVASLRWCRDQCLLNLKEPVSGGIEFWLEAVFVRKRPCPGLQCPQDGVGVPPFGMEPQQLRVRITGWPGLR